MKHTIYVSVGSNIDRENHVKSGIQAMEEAFDSLEMSAVYESESVGFEGTHFYNLVVKAITEHPINEVCKILKKIEQDNKRQRGEKKFAPRTLDLDLLLYDDQVLTLPVELPRPEILYNAFVLKPLADIAGNDLHPVAAKSYQMLWQEYDKNKQNLWQIDFDWSVNQ